MLPAPPIPTPLQEDLAVGSELTLVLSDLDLEQGWETAELISEVELGLETSISTTEPHLFIDNTTPTHTPGHTSTKIFYI